MTTILNPTPVNPQLLPASYNNLALSNILPAKKIVRTASSSDTNHAHDIEHQNYPKNYETLVTKTTLSLPPNKIAVSNIITPNICAATFQNVALQSTQEQHWKSVKGVLSALAEISGGLQVVHRSEIRFKSYKSS